MCLFIISGLIAIQFYLVRNTYRLNEKNYHNEVTAAFLKFQSTETYKAIAKGYYETLIESAVALDANKISETDFKASIQRKGKVVSGRLDSILRIEAKKTLKLMDVSERVSFVSIVIRGAKGVTIPIQKKAQPLIIGGLNIPDTKIIPIGESNGSIELNTGSLRLNTSYMLLKNLQVPAFPPMIIRQMVLIGGLSLLLLTSVVILFYFVLGSGLKQQRIAELRADLVNNITHELKTPLSSMAIAFKTLSLIENDHKAMPYQKLIATLERQHAKLMQTVNRVLESASGDSVLPIASIDIIAILKSYEEDVIFGSHPFSITAVPDVYFVKGSQSIIEAVIDNLLENASKYTAPGSPIQVIGKPDNERYRIDVIDTGKGIDHAFQKHLFNKFYRVAENNLHSVKGLGLGLYLSRKALNNIGGEISLTASSAQGSIFTIYLLRA